MSETIDMEGVRKMPEEKKEKLAEYAHDAWSGWMKYMFSKCEKLEGGAVIIPKASVERWERQMNTKYEDLPEEEKHSDRAEADKMLDIFNAD